MRFMVIVKATKDSESGKLPSTELLEAMGKYNEQLAKACVFVAGEGLHPTSKGARVKFSGGTRTVTQGPFDVQGLIAGFWIFDVKSREEAIDWVKKSPNPFDGESEIEIRQIFAPEDFGETLTPELKEREERLRRQGAAKR
ncbi:MAG TPA: YciI family protein [Stellaceae bacterium]|jgi:hypothetical protein|nr:YciI family protein [Stellaceae bacterium]